MELNHFKGMETARIMVELPKDIIDNILFTYEEAVLKTAEEGHDYPTLDSFLGFLLLQGYWHIDDKKP